MSWFQNHDTRCPIYFHFKILKKKCSHNFFLLSKVQLSPRGSSHLCSNPPHCLCFIDSLSNGVGGRLYSLLGHSWEISTASFGLVIAACRQETNGCSVITGKAKTREMSHHLVEWNIKFITPPCICGCFASHLQTVECVFGGLVYSDSLHIIKKTHMDSYFLFIFSVCSHKCKLWGSKYVKGLIFKKKYNWCWLAQEEANLHHNKDSQAVRQVSTKSFWVCFKWSMMIGWLHTKLIKGGIHMFLER